MNDKQRNLERVGLFAAIARTTVVVLNPASDLLLQITAPACQFCCSCRTCCYITAAGASAVKLVACVMSTSVFILQRNNRYT